MVAYLTFPRRAYSPIETPQPHPVSHNGSEPTSVPPQNIPNSRTSARPNTALPITAVNASTSRRASTESHPSSNNSNSNRLFLPNNLSTRVSVTVQQMFQQHRLNGTTPTTSEALETEAAEAALAGSSSPPRQVSSSNRGPSIHPQFRSKAVCKLFCNHCKELLCRRGMKAILLGNTKVELFSTDSPPTGVQLVFDDYTTPNCLCRIRDAACLGCGNVVGYHVTAPCARCLESCNNGHFWMFQSEEVYPIERSEGDGMKILRWANVKCATQDEEEPVAGTAVEDASR
ncbi:hypothetical protein CcCBS67573_g03726 [Chytriomyces confervae]|uniref:Protein FAM72 n=1 Tax=Chytriomyces confervae TaxID=246404 RepID=A0A507FFJ1_9FUNG|nr:Protein fam72a [Chytriomyces hyalinus]TPX74993.1 hypothetical protein CcCBS67573_g03726 [Chytriomyces confervae]